jgi:hypothetical protein
MNWLKCYYPIIPNCNIGDSGIEQANKYLLQRTNNSYVLRPFVSHLLLYWDSFYPRINQERIN